MNDILLRMRVVYFIIGSVCFVIAAAALAHTVIKACVLNEELTGKFMSRETFIIVVLGVFLWVFVLFGELRP